MKVLVIAPGCAPDQSGQSLRVFKWIQMIRSEAHVGYLSTHQREDPKITPFFHYHSFPDTWQSKIRKLWTYYKTDFQKMVLEFKPDIVQIHTPYFFGLEKCFPDTPIVFVEHNVNWNLLRYDMAAGPGLKSIPFPPPFMAWLQWRAKQFEKKYLKRASHTFVCSPVDRQEMLKELPKLADKITVIPNCLDVSAYTPSEKMGETVLFMGSMDYTANHDAVDIICQKLAPALPHIPFRILGSGSYAKTYPENVRFLGHVKEIKPHLEDCRLFIVPLRFGSGTRWKILEAFAMQRPVISTPKGAEGLGVTHGQNIWIAENEGLFIKAIQYLWNNPVEATAIAKKGRELVQTKYDYNLYKDTVINIYQKLLS
ncbi:MAG: glycosyltransferase family 4 protein [Deltaproteobacteria bacterium]|nr:glycosyltransferase family 4 protein [Deltaproteobacteria bacterium]